MDVNENNDLNILEQQAEQGDAEAQYRLGKIYIDYNSPIPCQKNNEAAKLFRKSAEQGHAEAQYEYGRCCFEHCGVECIVPNSDNRGEAIKWWKKSAEKGNADAQRMLNEIL